MSVAVVIPVGGVDCPHRARALDWVTDRYRSSFPWPVIHGAHRDGQWSKGDAVADGVERSDADILVIADGDSYTPTESITEAVDRVTAGTPWVVPHRYVHRFDQAATETVYTSGHFGPRRHQLVRRPYTGPAGGGIVVLSRTAYDTVGGVDRRFLGWGGEDVSFGWALKTLVGIEHRIEAPLWHLWHPHPAPDLRGSEQSEALVAEYTAALGVPRLMRAVIAGTPAPPAEWHDQPVTFRSESPSLVVRLGPRRMRFVDHLYRAHDGDEIDVLRLRPDVQEVPT